MWVPILFTAEEEETWIFTRASITIAWVFDKITIHIDKHHAELNMADTFEIIMILL